MVNGNNNGNGNGNITSSKPKELKKKGGWINTCEFLSIDGLLCASDLSSGGSASEDNITSSSSSGVSGNSSTSSFSSQNNSNNLLLELLNWKICREDYLLKKVNQLKSDRSISD
eukprot:553984_1